MTTFGNIGKIVTSGVKKATGAIGQVTDANNPNSLAFQNQFQQAAASGFFGPTTLDQLLASDKYQGLGNNTQAYDEAYQRSIAAQRSNITQMFGAALSDIQNRQNSGDQLIQGLPGQISQAYAPAEQSVKDNAAAAETAQRNSGLSTFLPASAISQPSVTAMETSQAAHQADVPVLHQAMNNEFGKERTSVQMQQAQAENDLASKEADYEMQSAQMKNEPSFMQKLLISNFQDQQQAKAAGDQKAAVAAQKKQTALSALQAKAGTVKPSSGKAFSNSPIVADQVNAIREGDPKAGRSASAYKAATDSIGAQWAADQRAASKGKTPSTKRIAGLYKQLMHKYPKQGAVVSMALYDLGMSDKDWQHITQGG